MKTGLIAATLKNPDYSAYVTIHFPISDEELSEKLSYVEFDKDCVTADCCVGNVEGDVPALKGLIGTTVNVDELNYLAKRLDSFGGDELPKFNAVVTAKKLTSMKDLINLTFNMGNYTLVTDFSDLAKIGFNNYMDIHGSISVQEKEKMDFVIMGEQLIGSGDGKTTPYGVVYRNDITVYDLYDGKHLPAYAYTSDFVFAAGIQNKNIRNDPYKTEWLYLPCSDLTIKKAMNRLGVEDFGDVEVAEYDFNLEFPESCFKYIESNVDLATLNEMCAAIKKNGR